ncbi:twin-arginine translocase TatA/TatE family subunit [Sulfurimonas sp.]|uniref:Sec-independent protein translocase subunit TatA/TatB n=1 Tax=Sulfurimonas sp. TaxID=2022749 RepID=UPI0025CFB3F5|nr:twin-arginine translocase TatA/TatE family subunit [Sulfurimonas sp.]MDD5157361.1 twin-arginine translocase TatA/TatE family subunit [Sulfurimonas sp.]
MGIGGQELLLILAIVVILFGAKKIPELAKGLGKGIKNFKEEMKSDSNDADDIKTASTTTPKEVNGAHHDTASSETTKTTTQA